MYSVAVSVGMLQAFPLHSHDGRRIYIDTYYTYDVRVSVGHVAGFPRLEGGGCKKPLPQLVRRTDHGVVGSQRGWQDDHHDHADRYRHIIKQLNARTHSYIGSIVHVTA